MAPVIIHATNTSATSIMVDWDPLPAKFWHGVPRGYKLTYWESEQTDSTRTIVVADQTNYELLELKKFTVYYVKLTAFTSKGTGPWGRAVEVSSDEHGK